VIRPEAAGDERAVRTVVAAAFGRAAEADLVERLRARVSPLVSLVAVAEDGVVGHILFSPVEIGSPGSAPPAMALGPMAVAPEHQRAGVGGDLVRAGLEACRRMGRRVVFVLGHPDYYPRFGFVPAAPRGLSCRWPVPPEVFMVTELEAGALGGARGLVRYDAAFDDAG
jgi:putative acetyltransferase